MASSQARKTADGYRSLTDIPMDLAAAGFTVTVSQSEEAGWRVEVSKTLTADAHLHLLGDARSYVSALFQIADQAGAALDALEAAARREWARAREAGRDAA